MSRDRDHSHPTDAFGLPEGLLAAIVCAVLLVGLFAFVSAAAPMPPAEYTAALTTFALLTVGVALPGCAAVYDTLGRTVRTNRGAALTLVAVIPTLFIAYAFAVRELTWQGAVGATLFVAVPFLAFSLAGTGRAPTLLDAVALVYLLVSLAFGLVPALTLPQQSGLVAFFQYALIPLLLLLFAMRGWPGLGYTWHVTLAELRDAAVAGVVALACFVLVGLGSGQLAAPQFVAPTASELVLGVFGAYFFMALPVELLLRGGVQNGLERALRGPMGATAAWVALVVSGILTGLIGLALNGGVIGVLTYILAGLAAAWTYKRTGKVAASALAHTIVPLWFVVV